MRTFGVLNSAKRASEVILLIVENFAGQWVLDLKRDCEDELCAFSELALDFCLATHLANDNLTDAEAKTGPCMVLFLVLFQARVVLEEFVSVVFRDASSIIFEDQVELDVNWTVVGLRSESAVVLPLDELHNKLDVTLLRSELHAVGHEV